jgi:hypothetical protein
MFSGTQQILRSGKQEVYKEAFMGRFVKCVKVKFRLYQIACKIAKLEAINKKVRHLKTA